MTKKKRWFGLAAILAATIAMLASPAPDVGAPGDRAVVRDGKIVFSRGTPHRAPAVKRPADPATAARAEAWLSAHPPKPALRDALLDIAARADEIATPLPTAAPEDDDAAAERAAANEERTALQSEFRSKLRSTLRAMTAGERAALRASHVHIIQLARHVASRG